MNIELILEQYLSRKGTLCGGRSAFLNGEPAELQWMCDVGCSLEECGASDLIFEYFYILTQYQSLSAIAKTMAKMGAENNVAARDHIAYYKKLYTSIRRKKAFKAGMNTLIKSLEEKNIKPLDN